MSNLIHNEVQSVRVGKKQNEPCLPQLMKTVIFSPMKREGSFHLAEFLVPSQQISESKFTVT